jgi:hypothetical protein
LIGKSILKIECAKPALHIGGVVVLWERLGDYYRRWWPGYTLPGEAHSFVYASLVWWKRVKLKNAQTWLFHMEPLTSLGSTGGMRSTSTSALKVMLKLPPLKQVARQAANRVLGNGCSYMPNFGHLTVLIKMTDEMPIVGSKGQFL